MKARASIVILATTALALSSFAKDKDKVTLPPYVLLARTVAVVIDSSAGVDLSDPQANRVAQKDVETAMLNWGRLQPVITTQSADLIIVVRRGHKKLVDATVTDPQQNRRAGVILPSDDGVSIGAQRGQQPPLSGGGIGQPGGETPRPQVEAGNTEDVFLVFQGNVDAPLDGIPAWRYTAKDALHPHNVPAVSEFRKAIVEAEKAAAKHP